MIRVSGPWITQKEIDYVSDAVKNAWYSNANIYHDKFEQGFASYVGRKHSIALPSCTSAIHLSLLAASIKEGDEVIVPDATWIATSAPISYVGATPVFADVDEHSWCITAASIDARITPKTKAVILVDLYGNMPDMDAIELLAKERNLVVIEDAAEAVGSEFKHRKAGSFGFSSTFSFHGSKTLTTGEGGMLLTDSDEIFERVLFLRDHGRDASSTKLFWNSQVAYKYKMSSMQAALGLAQLERVEELVQKKRQIFSWYQTHLSIEDVVLNFEHDNVKNTYWMVTVLIGKEYKIEKELIIQALKDFGIDCRPFFYPLSSLPAYSHLAAPWRERNPVSYKLSECGINLPSGLSLTEESVAYVCEKLKIVLASCRA